MPVDVFNRVATYDVPGVVAEIVASTPDAELLIYTDSAAQAVGFVTITDPKHPTSAGLLSMPGEPTSVAVTPDGAWALVAVHAASQNALVVVDLTTLTISTTIPLGGQPDSVAISGDGRYAAIAIENERDEEVKDGAMPQDPPGFLTIVDLVGMPSAWATRDVMLTGLAERFPDDPEPEYVSINASHQAAVTLQENNHVVIVDLVTGTVVRHWPAGTTTHAHDRTFLFVGAERGNFVAVYHLDDETNPTFVQILPTSMGPEGLLPIPQRDLFVTANEEDGTISIFQGQSRRALTRYPQAVSAGLPWSALSGLAAGHGHSVYAVPDNVFSPSRIWTLEVERVAKVTSALTITKDG
jgi:DNA-binding beta-propeller fold protein YncE